MLFPKFWAFDRRCSSNVNEVIAISKFDLLFDLVIFDLATLQTSVLNQDTSVGEKEWRYVSVCDLCVKMCQFHLNMNIEGWFCRHGVTSLLTSSAWTYFLGLFACVRSISDVKLRLPFESFKILKFSIVTKFWCPVELFRRECHRKLGMLYW